MPNNVYITVKDVSGEKGILLEDDLVRADGYVRIVPDVGQAFLASHDALVKQADGTYLIATTFSSLSIVEAVQTPEDMVALPVIVEEAHIEKSWRDTGTVHVSKRTVEREHQIEELLRQETVEIERVPVNQMVATMPVSRTEDDVIIIPVVEEIVVVEKRLMLKEEIRIRRRSTEQPYQETVILREEQVEVIRTPSDDTSYAAQSTS